MRFHSFAALLLAASLPLACATHPAVKPAAAPKLNEQGQAFLTECRDKADFVKKTVADLKAKGATLPILDGLARYNDIETALDDTLNRAGLYQQAHPEADVRQAGLTCEQELSDLATTLTLDHELYQVFAGYEPKLAALDTDSRRYLTKTLRDFRRNGVDKDATTRDKLRALNKRMTELAQVYDTNLAADTRKVVLDGAARLKGLPADFIAAHKPDAQGRITITTDWPDYYPIMLYADDVKLREELYNLNWNLGYPKNATVFKELLVTRHAIATTLGFPNWAAYAQDDLMIHDPDHAQRFIDEVTALATPRMKSDLDEMLAFKRRQDPQAPAVLGYEKSYLARLVTAEKYHYSPEQARPYFELNKVKKGILDISSALYGIRFVPVADAPRWHKDVDTYDVFEGTERIGRIYLDLYPRDNKYKSFAMFPLVRGLKDKRVAEGSIIGNFPAPTAEAPTYIDHLDVTTFFHEFGHLMHHILSGKQVYSRFSGTATEWDFVEAPSQLNEEWAWDPAILSRFATDAKGEVIPADLVARMKAADEFAKGVMVRQQMYYAALSLALYVRDPQTVEADAVQREMEARYSPWPATPDVHPVCGFSHLVGYSSNYYTYMWSLSIAKDLNTRFSAAGHGDPATAMAYRHAVLERGGAEDAAKLVETFLGRPTNLDAFKAYLQ